MMDACTQADDEVIEAKAWKNLHFLKDGRSFAGWATFHSEEEALRHELEQEKSTSHKWARHRVWDGSRIIYLQSDYSHAIQIPWSGE